MNAPCEQVNSKKVSDCAWSIRGDVGQVSRKRKTFSCSCKGNFWPGGSSSSWLSRPFIILLDVSRIEVLLEISVKVFLTCLCNRAKGNTFLKSPYFVVFSSFGWARDILPMIHYLAVVKEFPSWLLPFWVVYGGIIDH